MSGKPAPAYGFNDYPRGGPLFWMNESSGVLRDAVEALLEPAGELTPRQLALLKAYCIHWILAPCWAWPEDAPPRQGLVKLVGDAADKPGLWTALEELFEWGIDPL